MVLLEQQTKKLSSKGNTSNWSCEFHTNTEVINDTKPNYHIKNLPERYNEALLKKLLSTKEDKKTLRDLHLNIK